MTKAKLVTNFTIIIATLIFLVGAYHTADNFFSTDGGVKEVSMSYALDAMEHDDDNIFYFGYEGCPYCQKAKPILSKVATKTRKTIYYVKTRDSKKNLLYTDKQRKKLTKYISKYMSRNKDEDNKLWLYVPLVVRVKDGVVVKGYEGIGNDESKLNKKQAKKLYRKYLEIMS